MVNSEEFKLFLAYTGDELIRRYKPLKYENPHKLLEKYRKAAPVVLPLSKA